MCQICFGTNHYYYFHLPFWPFIVGPFHCAKLTKKCYSRSKFVRMSHLWIQLGEFAPPPPAPKFFCVEIYWYHFHLTISCFHCAKFQKSSSSRSRVMRMCNFFGIKWLICPNDNFFRKSVNEPCSFHSYLLTCQKSKWDINLLVKYWRLKNTETLLPMSHFWL